MGQLGPTRVVVVEIEPVDDHLSGWLIDASGSKHRFDSWLEFASAFAVATRTVEDAGGLAE